MSDEPRIARLAPEQWTGDLKRILEAMPAGAADRLGDHNIFRTFANHTLLLPGLAARP